MEKKSFGSLLSALRKANGMTQKDLAERLNVSDKAVSRWERDENYPDLPLLPVIAEIFGVTTDELLRGERNNPETGGPNTTTAPDRSAKQVKRLTESVTSRYLVGCIIAFCALIAAIVLRSCAHAAYTPVYAYDSYSKTWEINPRSVTGSQILFALAQGFAWVVWVAGLAFVTLTYFNSRAKLSDADFPEHETSLSEGTCKLKRIFRWTLSLIVAGFGLLIMDLAVENKVNEVLGPGLLCFLFILVAFHLLWWLLPKLFTRVPVAAAYMRSEPFFKTWKKKCIRITVVILLLWLFQLFAGIRTDGLIYAPGRVFFSFDSFQEYMVNPQGNSLSPYSEHDLIMARTLRSVTVYEFDLWTKLLSSVQPAFYHGFVPYSPCIMLANSTTEVGEDTPAMWPDVDLEHSFSWKNAEVGAILLGDFDSFLPIRVCTATGAEIGFWIFVVVSVAIPVIVIPLIAWILWRKCRRQYDSWNTGTTETDGHELDNEPAAEFSDNMPEAQVSDEEPSPEASDRNLTGDVSNDESPAEKE